MRSVICAVVAIALASAPARADDWTPFYDSAFEVEKTYERSASVAWLGGEKYILLVKSDTAQTFVVYATAKADVVKPEQLGGNKTVKAKVLSREKDPSGRGFRVHVEILAVK